MLRILIRGIQTTANALLIHDQNIPNNQSSTSKWRSLYNFLFSAFSSIGIPLLRTFTGSDTLFEFVNAYLANTNTTRNNIVRHQRRSSGVSQLSRPNFRRRTHHNHGVVRFIRPTIHIHIHQP